MANELEDFLDAQLHYAGFAGSLYYSGKKPSRTFFSNPANKDRSFLTRVGYGLAETTLGWIPLAVLSLEFALITVAYLFKSMYDLVTKGEIDSIINWFITTTTLADMILTLPASPLLNLIDCVGYEIKTAIEPCMAPA